MNNSNLQKYQDVQAGVQKEIETMFPKLFKQYATQFGVNKTPTHTHNGTDSVRINEVDLVGNVKYGFGIQGIYSGAPEVIQMRAIPNMSKITLFGFGANNVSGPATKRALFNGHAAFGRCFTFDDPGALVTPTIPVQGINLLQGGNGYYTDSTDVAKTRVSFSNENIIYVTDDSGSAILTMTIDSYDQNVIQLTLDITNADWQIFFSIIMS